MNALRKRLVIDTATNYLYIALYEDKNLIESIYTLGHQDHSMTLMPSLNDLFKRHQIKPKAIDEIYVGVGPGSYTGIRIGVVVAKMLGWSLNKPVFKVSSLALIASSVLNDGKIIPYIDARRGFVFTGLYELENGLIKGLIDDQYTDFEPFKSMHTYDYLIDQGAPDMTKLFDTNLVKQVTNIHDLSPVYLRDTEAERALKTKNE